MSELGLPQEDADALRTTGRSGPTAASFELAGWWSRVGAYLIDVVILVVGLIVLAGVGGIFGREVAILLIVLWVVAALLGYWAYFEGSESGQTLGKRACGIRVCNDEGGRASYGQALGRNIVGRVIGAIPFVGLVDVLWPLWDSNNQCLHDKAASTIVVRA
jgi:uncharacterized RDD family membrane protein YckC